MMELSSIGDYAFYFCDRLTSATIGNRVKYIYESTFNGCPDLTQVIIHSDFIDTHPYSFSYCENLKDIQFKGTKKQAVESGIGNKRRKLWREDSPIDKIICTDGVIELT